mmetsp:Transcript_76968/g.213916  ORF Transcript_76968/g.213916 Transcript_76968/m.213916 type:complete len:225 (-) Transcript_76968:719-1393(-)
MTQQGIAELPEPQRSPELRGACLQQWRKLGLEAEAQNLRQLAEFAAVHSARPAGIEHGEGQCLPLPVAEAETSSSAQRDEQRVELRSLQVSSVLLIEQTESCVEESFASSSALQEHVSALAGIAVVNHRDHHLQKQKESNQEERNEKYAIRSALRVPWHHDVGEIVCGQQDLQVPVRHHEVAETLAFGATVDEKHRAKPSAHDKEHLEEQEHLQEFSGAAGKAL